MEIKIGNNDVTIQKKWLWGALSLLGAVLLAFVLSYFGLMAGILLVLLPFALLYTIVIYNQPIVGLYMMFIYSFFIFALTRYLIRDAFPAGILFDGLLAFSYLVLILKGMAGEVEWTKMKAAPIGILSIWLVYCMSSLIIPESTGFSTWIYGVRVHLYMALTIPLFCLLLDAKTIKTMITLWGVFSMILTLKAFMQLHVGLDSVDKEFLAGNPTHIIWGKIRAFSFCSDAGQFGVQQAHAATSGAFLFLSAENKKRRFFYFLMVVTGLFGMFSSGTRGAIFVIFGGVLAYCFLVKKVKLLLLAAFCGGLFFCVMRYTYIGNGVYEIQRMRTAFRPGDDPSYLVRKNNQKILKAYMASRPFGGGLGAMDHGPEGSVLRRIPYDSGYVLTWGEQGIVGLCLYIGMFIFFLIKGAIAVWFKIRNEWLRGVLIALIAGISGDAVAHYGNPVMLQHPTCMVIFFSIAVIFISPYIDKKLMEGKVEDKPKTDKMVKYR